MDHQDWGEASGLSDFLVLRTENALIHSLAVAVLNERREQLQSVALGTSIFRRLRSDVVELGPAPSRIYGRLHESSRQHSLDHGGVELLGPVRSLGNVLGVG